MIVFIQEQTVWFKLLQKWSTSIPPWGDVFGRDEIVCGSFELAEIAIVPRQVKKSISLFC